MWRIHEYMNIYSQQCILNTMLICPQNKWPEFLRTQCLWCVPSPSYCIISAIMPKFMILVRFAHSVHVFSNLMWVILQQIKWLIWTSRDVVTNMRYKNECLSQVSYVVTNDSLVRGDIKMNVYHKYWIKCVCC